eukprot:NODE_2987_length_1301_cov_116.439728_g2836_i0.p1 GENE.NODE_2987_length_1301_cov_116.439728_g2836_i0~~NODE_2987_length_1301_cov_116.439728_g2836_i0.p1  ORF type:complete len:395 (-),score=68.74 NODE_2987_length_1301_cov_116.439728_g2836_i0:116-1237(-)
MPTAPTITPTSAPKKGCRFFRQNIVMATLSSRSIEISSIREKDNNPGLREYEANFLKLIDRVTNGCAIQILSTGTVVRYRPGVLIGGKFSHECNPARGIGYYLEALVMLAPFCKTPIEAKLMGVTNKDGDIGVDAFRTITIPLLAKFGVEASLRVQSRGAAPLGGGCVVFQCEPVRKLQGVELLDVGKVKRIRGLAYGARVSPQMANRAATAAKGVLLKFIPDVFITSDHFKGKDSGLCPGYGMTAVAESTSKNVFMSQELAPDADTVEKEGMTPENVGEKCAMLLLDEIARGGCVDTAHQALVILLMSLADEVLSKVVMGQLTPYGEHMQVLVEEHFGVAVSVTKQKRYRLPPAALVACIGTSYTNLVKRSS